MKCLSTGLDYSQDIHLNFTVASNNVERSSIGFL